jgi:hypothetical protein
VCPVRPESIWDRSILIGICGSGWIARCIAGYSGGGGRGSNGGDTIGMFPSGWIISTPSGRL